MKHLISTKQIESQSQLENLFNLADIMKSETLTFKERRVLAIVKNEASTRTRLSFEVAMKRLGGDVVNIQLDETTSIAKGETLQDTIKTISQYVDAMTIRHSTKGIMENCVNWSSIPVINAGDGNGEHPTQALIDAYTIFKEFGRLDNLNIMFVGDLENSRTVHSLIKLFCLFKQNNFIFVSNSSLENITHDCKCYKDFELSLSKHGNTLDVLYMTRFQKERHQSKSFYEVVPYYKLTEENVKNLSSHCRVMHPLPRCEEIPTSFDSDHRATYFRQMNNGMYIRMALLYNLFENQDYFARYNTIPSA